MEAGCLNSRLPAERALEPEANRRRKTVRGLTCPQESGYEGEPPRAGIPGSPGGVVIHMTGSHGPRSLFRRNHTGHFQASL